MGTDTLNLQDADDVVIISVRSGEIQVQSSVDSREEFFTILNIVAEMAEEYYPEENVDNLH
jgi:antitoxin component of MazEF toxin-antitoxin module